ncbi:MAG: NADH-quinone oxidoreductase subunit H [Deltaproteobacteria bacterium]|nr:NADH-quinone oxidoreductase subunit H [Deltaproteobacteria bacterium]
MNLAQLIFTVIKIAAILGFALGVGGALTWNDRRMSAMMQDRVGPNRAAFVLPSWLARIMFAGPAMLVAGALAAWTYFGKLPETPAGAHRATERIFVTAELSVLLLWIGLAVLTTWAVRRGPSNALEKWLAETVRDPRRIFYAGLAAHLLIPMGRVGLSGTETGAQLKSWLVTASPIALAAILAAGGILAGLKVPDGGFRLRMAGLLHTAADGLKMIFKEDFMPAEGDRLLHSIAPMIALLPPLVIMAVVPFGDVLCLQGGLSRISAIVPRSGLCMDPPSIPIPMQIADLDIGILFIFAIAGTGIIGAALAGWASDNKYSLLGGLRAASQMVSYEVTLGLTLVGSFMIFRTLRLDDMVRWQGENAWGIFVQPFAFILFFAAATAETKRIPFDLPEGESEIVGYFTEYSGMKFGMFFFAEYVEVVTSSALLVTLFLGGWNLPFLHRDGLTIAIGDATLLRYPMTHISVTLIQIAAFFGKVLLMCLVQATVRWTLPRFRYDQLMKLGWRVLLPLSLANIVVTGIALLLVDRAVSTTLDALRIAAEVSQALVALGIGVGIVALVLWLLRPIKREPAILSTSAEIADEQGGTRTSPMQA